jgi:hypothetical protein
LERILLYCRERSVGGMDKFRAQPRTSLIIPIPGCGDFGFSLRLND